MNKHLFYKDHYFHEINRKEMLQNQFSLPLIFFPLLFNSAFYIFKTLSHPYSCLECVIIISLIICFFFSIVAIYFLGRAYLGGEYSYIDTHLKWQEYEKKLSNEGDQEKIFEDALNSQYAKSIDHNQSLNDRRSEDLYKTKRSTIGAVIFLIIAGISSIIIH